MKLTIEAFRAHIQTMWNKKNKAQLQLWIEQGLLIYVNFAELQEIWEEEYEDEFHQL
jgi:hypothetical protein